jgi:hypothetical protein
VTFVAVVELAIIQGSDVLRQDLVGESCSAHVAQDFAEWKCDVVREFLTIERHLRHTPTQRPEICSRAAVCNREKVFGFPYHYNFLIEVCIFYFVLKNVSHVRY